MIYDLRTPTHNGLQRSATGRLSHHAYFRFIERMFGMTPEEASKLIITDQLRERVNTVGAGKFPVLDGTAIAVVKGKTVVTIYGRDE